MNEESLATELLGEVKASARRWFIAFCIMIGLEIATIAGFMWYISLPVEETSAQEPVEEPEVTEPVAEEPAQEPVKVEPVSDDPNKQLSPDEIAALFASIG